MTKRPDCFQVLPFLSLLVALVLVTVGCFPSKTAQSQPVVVITAPTQNDVLTLGQTATIQAVATHSQGITRVELWVNGQQAQTQALPSPQTAFTAALAWTPPVVGTYGLEVRAFDAQNQSGSATVFVSVVDAGQSPTASPSATETPSGPAPTATEVVDLMTEESEPTSQKTTSPKTPIPSATPSATSVTGTNATATAGPSATPGDEPGSQVTSTPTTIPPMVFYIWADAETLTCDKQSTYLHWRVEGGLIKQITLKSCSYEEQQAAGGCAFSDERKVTLMESPITISPRSSTTYYLTAQSWTKDEQVIEDQGATTVYVEGPWSPFPIEWQPGNALQVGQTGACQVAQTQLGVSVCSGSMVFSPDGSEVAAISSKGVFAITTNGGAVTTLYTPPTGTGFGPNGTITWSPGGEYIAFAYVESTTNKMAVGVVRRYSQGGVNFWNIAPEGDADWPRWTTDQRLLVRSAPGSNRLDNVYVAWLSGPPAEVHPATRCESYELAPSAPRQQYFPWGPGRTWVGESEALYEKDTD